MATIILILCYCFIVWLYRKDISWRKASSLALLLPGIWIGIRGSRDVASWLGSGGGTRLEGDPINTFTFAFLIGAAFFVVARRGLDWGRLIRNNKALFFIYLLLALSAFWSEMPLVSFKRMIKDFGCIPVALVLLTETDASAMLRMVCVRVSYVLFPLSVVYIKYFPNIGRLPDRAGDYMFTGVTTDKNTLGQTIFVFSLFLIWDLVELWKAADRPGKKLQIRIRLGILLIGFWLLMKCDSKTSLLCLILGVVVFWGAGRLRRMRNGKKILISCLATVIALVLLDSTFQLSDTIIRALGRDPTLTGRTDIWKLVMEQKTDPLLGMGYYTFWDSEKGLAVVEAYKHINSAHNGFLEVYLDCGLVGDFALCLMLLAAGARFINRLFRGDPLGRMGLMFWLIAIVYNFSESSFFRPDPLWFILVLLMLEVPRRIPQGPIEERTYEMRRPEFAEFRGA